MNKYLKYVILVCFLFMLCGCKKVENKLNYTLTNNVYEIENTKYIESKEETNFIKIEVKDYGIIVAELFEDVAPITVKNYKKLVSEKFYDNLIFHRVIKDFMIQTGDPTSTGYSGSDETIKGEFEINGIKNDLSHIRGVLSMARSGSNPETEETMNSASSQFFIVQQNSTYLDGKYAAFGRVINGLDVVDNVASVVTNNNDRPIKDQTVTSIRFVIPYEEEIK